MTINAIFEAIVGCCLELFSSDSHLLSDLLRHEYPLLQHRMLLGICFVLDSYNFLMKLRYIIFLQYLIVPSLRDESL